MPNEDVKPREALYWARRGNLEDLIRHQFAGSYEEFSQRMGWPQEAMRHFFYSALGGRRWPITDLAAREIERKLALAEKSLDAQAEDVFTEVTLYRYKVR